MVKFQASQELFDFNNRIKSEIDAIKFNKEVRVLLLDENKGDAEIFQNLVEAYNPLIIVDYAKSISECLKFLHKDTSIYSYFFLDVNLSGVSIEDFLEKIKDFQIFEKGKINILSSGIKYIDILNLKQLNAKMCFIDKPLSIEKFANIFNQKSASC